MALTFEEGESIHVGLYHKLFRSEEQIDTGRHSHGRFTGSQRLHSLVHCNQARRARGVDSHRRALPVEEVGDATGCDATSSASDGVFWGGVYVARQHVVVIVIHLAHIDGRVGTLELWNGVAGIFKALVDNFKQQPLLRVHSLSLFSADAEEGMIKITRIFT